MHRALAAFASVLATAVLLAAPAPARAFFSLELHYGVERADATSLKHGLDAALSDTARLKNSAQIVGGLATLKLGFLELGAVADRTWKKDGPSITAVGGLAGLGFDLGAIRLEALGEAGGRRYGDFLKDPAVITRGSNAEWLAYVGLRPGIAYRAELGGGLGFLIGVWGFARWDVTSKNVPVTVRPSEGGPDTSAEYELGGVTFGATGRVGIDF
ncbi:hypothetical protein [Anaeromyxobacter sp. PSR-1]|uniref:hypothetical protein n=1 Tax=Anaeromyxobacter sp. PSR-1 TaxID=1300915 RepID=UPI0005E69385|nr:hypothetical protein [Anaeromyxobacter sp. PSR-1]GAO05082.1 hypothetical protein PSR1_03989 [Anaeromyxobacter sp. PSR-1]